MNYLELRNVVFDAYRQKDYDLCFSLIDDFIETSSGTERGKALCLKASVIIWVDPRRSPEGLFLVDESLEYCKDDPGEAMRSVINALALCHTLGDVYRARKYEALGTGLLQKCEGDPTTSQYRYRLHGNLCRIAGLRGEHATAYWHGMQALVHIRELGFSGGTDHHCVYVALSMEVVDAALQLGRIPEAEETLNAAYPHRMTPGCSVWWAIQRAKIWHFMGRGVEAESVMSELDPKDIEASTPVEHSRYHLMMALLAQDRGNWRQYHQHVTQAQQIAVSHSLEYILAEIQRVQRSSICTEVMK